MAAASSGKVRSIIISFDEGSDVMRSDLEFAKRLADMRALYPSWHIRGVVHGRDLTFIPQRPPSRASNTLAEAPTSIDRGGGSIAEYLAQCSAQAPLDADACGRHDGDRDNDDVDVSSASSVGNVPGAPPARVVRGALVRVVVPPYDGKVATIAEVKDRDRFKVAFVDGGGWWCARDDVEFVASGGDWSSRLPSATEELPITPSTLEANRSLAERLDALQRTSEALRVMLRRAMITLGETLSEGAGGASAADARRRARELVALTPLEEAVLAECLLRT